MGYWDLEELFKQPHYELIDSDGWTETILYENEEYLGESTRVFAHLGVPVTERDSVPGMVLIHDEGGTAYRDWVRMWTARGYAAIAIDLGGKGLEGKPLSNGGPASSLEVKFAVSMGWENAWTRHAVAAVIRAHSLLRKIPVVDPRRIGLTGNGWGGYLTCIAAGLDPRFACAIPVYGCGNVLENRYEKWAPFISKMTEEQRAWWNKRCEPTVYLKNATMPMLFIGGANDPECPLYCLEKTIQYPKGPVMTCVRPDMPHSYEAASATNEIHWFTNYLFLNEPALPRVGPPCVVDGKLSAAFSSELKAELAQLHYTTDTGKWQERKWKSIPANIQRRRIIAEIPENVTGGYFSVSDFRGAFSSSSYWGKE
jgi:dienelactone hydrolase